MLSTSLKLLTHILGNLASRKFLSLGSGFCDDCEMSQLEHAIARAKIVITYGLLAFCAAVISGLIYGVLAGM